MPTPPKSWSVLTNEKISHRTKAELDLRLQGERALETGEKIKESKAVKSNKDAHLSYLRLIKLLKKIDKNDAIYEQVINRYCLMLAECLDFEKKRERAYRDLENADDAFDNDELEAKDYFKITATLNKTIIDFDKQVQTKRRMLLDIEKENLMTIAAALRSIPKKVDDFESETPMSQLLGRGRHKEAK